MKQDPNKLYTCEVCEEKSISFFTMMQHMVEEHVRVTDTRFPNSLRSKP